MADQPWRLDARAASLRLARFSAVVHPLQPGLGLGELQLDGSPISGACRPLAVELFGARQPLPPTAVEEYRRGADLVATYAECPAPALRTQIYWRASSHPVASAIAAIELVISVQTSLLDSSPRLATHSTLCVDEAICVSRDDSAKEIGVGKSSCYLYRLADAPFSYAEMVHPAQSQETAIKAAETVGATRDAAPTQLELRHELFCERLEKGVILRARVLGVFLDRRDDLAAAKSHYAAFLTAEPPLTT